ncbi:MAG: hypothetical protein R3C41_19720 [Calditrichia bacterium]|nr:hypothetical protein [Calditrichota bacterium]MCB0269180.1 hypothetical protein [Calditrichota bacterium]MCB9066972.1 hypothetical protein [Calditrichia bacterium]
MNYYWLAASFFTVLLSMGHSWMGERHFLPRLFKHEYPENLEIDEHVNRSTRTAWHLTTLGWLNMAAILLIVAIHPDDPIAILVMRVTGAFCLVSGIYSLAGSRGRHLLGLIFLLISLLILLGDLF